MSISAKGKRARWLSPSNSKGGFINTSFCYYITSATVHNPRYDKHRALTCNVEARNFAGAGTERQRVVDFAHYKRCDARALFPFAAML